MGYSRKKFEKRGYDEAEYKRYFQRNQAEHIRKKLRSIQLYNEGNEFKEVASTLSIHWQSVRKYINEYILGGFDLLCKKIIRKQPTYLTDQQMLSFKDVLLSKRPVDVGLEGNIWTGNLMKLYIKNTYQVTYNSGIYDLLERLNLSHQKAHFDYSNADIEKQKGFVEDLREQILASNEKTAIVFFDEFSINERPTSYYGWAEKNTRPKVATDEKNAVELTDF